MSSLAKSPAVRFIAAGVSTSGLSVTRLRLSNRPISRSRSRARAVTVPSVADLLHTDLSRSGTVKLYVGLSNVDVSLRVCLSLSGCLFCRGSCLCVLDGQAPAIGEEKAIYGACSGPTEPDESIPITGVWTFGVSAGTDCVTTLPFGYGTAPRGGGQATLTQSGNRFSGELLIFGVPSGSIDGTLQGNNVVEASLRLDGTNQGPFEARRRAVSSGC
jgi:hypothetical protein